MSEPSPVPRPRPPKVSPWDIIVSLVTSIVCFDNMATEFVGAISDDFRVNWDESYHLIISAFGIPEENSRDKNPDEDPLYWCRDWLDEGGWHALREAGTDPVQVEKAVRRWLKYLRAEEQRQVTEGYIEPSPA